MDIDISSLPINFKKVEKEKESLRTEIKIYDDSLSLLQASQMILLTNDRTRYDVVLKHNFVAVRRDKVVETSKTKQKYVLLYFQSRENMTFHDFLFHSLHTPKLLVLHVIMSYKAILTSLHDLEQQLKISFSNFSSDNIVFCKKSLRPIITKFENATFNQNQVAMMAVNELYSNIIHAVIVSFSLSHTVLNALFSLLRERKLDNLLNKVMNLYDTCNWDFVLAMSQSKMETFYSELID